MPRLFTALELPLPLRIRLSLLGAPLRGAKWVDSANMHLTLRFAGDIDGRQADDFATALAEIVMAPFMLRLDGLGAFGGRDPKVIWAGVTPSPALEQLQRSNERAARLAGLAAEPHAFKPHVTLARLRGGRAHEVARYLETHGLFSSEPFEISRFVLLSAKPGRGGGPYAVEEAYPPADPELAAKSVGH